MKFKANLAVPALCVRASLAARAIYCAHLIHSFVCGLYAQNIRADAPIAFAKACEMFIMELTTRAWAHADENKRRTLQVFGV